MPKSGVQVGFDSARERGGHVVDAVEIYAAQPAEALSEEATSLIEAGEIGAVLHYSGRSADIFLALSREARVNVVGLAHVAISADAVGRSPTRRDALIAARRQTVMPGMILRACIRAGLLTMALVGAEAAFTVTPARCENRFRPRSAFAHTISILDIPATRLAALLMQFDESEFRGSVDGDEEVKFTLFGADLCNVDMKEADPVGFKLLL